MKSLRLLATLLGIAAAASSAQASLLFVTTFDANLGNPNEELQYLLDNYALAGEEGLVYLAKVGDTDENGAVNASLFTVDSIGGTSADVSWDLTGSGFDLHYVLVKDGAGENPPESLYSLYRTDDAQRFIGDEQTVTFPGFERGISHVTFFGLDDDHPGHGETPGVPDGGMTLILMGLGLSSVVAIRRLIRG